MRYQFTRNIGDNEGIGEFSLPSVGFNSHSTEKTVQITDTQVVSPTIVNETRFQYIRDSDTLSPLSTDPTDADVQGAFTGGGSSQGTVLQPPGPLRAAELTSIARGRHFFKFGGRLRGTLFSSTQNADFNGHLQLFFAERLPDHARSDCSKG